MKIRFESEARFITIDGPAGSGKTTLGGELAGCIDGGFHVDTGSIHRIVTAFGLWKQQDPDSLFERAEVLRGELAKLTLSDLSGDSHPAWIPIDFHIRSPAVNLNVSRYATSRLRPIVDAESERISLENIGRCLIFNGRGEYQRIMASTLEPHLLMGLYLTLDPRERARRRALEILGREPTESEVDEEMVLITDRDARDRDNLVVDGNALEIDHTELLDEVRSPADQISGSPQISVNMKGFSTDQVPAFTRGLLRRHAGVVLVEA